MAQASIAVSRFSTAAWPEAERYDAWRSRPGPSAAPLYDTRPIEPFASESVSASLGGVGLAFTHITSQDWLRPADRARRDGVDMIAASIRFDGAAHGDANGRSLFAPTGSIVLSDLARPLDHRSERSHSAYMLFPRAQAERVLGPSEGLHGLIVPPGAATLLRSHLLALEPVLGDTPASVADRLGSTLIDLMAVAVAQVAPVAVSAGSRRTALRLAAERLIDERLGSPSLTVTNLGRWLGISRATLFRLFEVDGGVQGFIRDRRLARVAAELCAGVDPIADIAERWGFCDGAYLARVFREAHGIAPGDFRARHAGQRGGPVISAPPR